MADLRDRLQAGLTAAYAIERELGRGGMAVVYLARDLRHDRLVALKLLHPELGATLGADRFLREIRLAARLQHPHILTVLDSGQLAEPGGPPLLWFTMPYVEGESLRDRLNRERQLSLEDALKIAREVADALQYAHDHGVVHRDIKPENILLAGQHALVSDFGIARAAGADEHLTGTGLAVGTPAYMSPEQATGERDLDARTDIYALGCVLYEMLAGEPPFTGPTAQAIVARALTESPRPLHRTREGVSDAVDAVIAKAMARTPADRYPTAAQFAAALEPALHQPVPLRSGEAGTRVREGRRVPLLAMLVLGFAVGVGVLFAWRRSHSDAEDANARTIAVLPFENLGDSANSYFADGVADAVRGKLTGLPGMQVTARTSSIQYKHTTKQPQEIGRELGVRYLLTGTVRWEKRADGSSRVQVSPELIDVSSGVAMWQQPFDAALTDVFQVQGDIAGKVAGALNVALVARQQQQLAERPTENLAAYDAFLKGEEISNSIGIGDAAVLRRAIGYYEQAVALDSSFAEAWAQLSRARSLLYTNGVPTPALAEGARMAGERSLALEPERAEGRLALGDYYIYVLKDRDQALAQYDQGRRIAARNAELLGAAAVAEQQAGRFELALEHFKQAQTLDPRSITVARRLARTLLWLRRYPEALEAYDRALALAPTLLIALEEKSMGFLAQGDLNRAREVLRNPSAVEPAVLVSNVAVIWDLFWVLDDGQQQLLLGLPPGGFDDDRGAWAIVRAQTFALRGNQALARAYADSARLAFIDQLRVVPTDAQRVAMVGLALAYMGRKAEAITEGERGLAIASGRKDSFQGPYLQHVMARICILTGEYDKALDYLEPLLKMPYYLSRDWLKIDPAFDPLRSNPRFQRLVAGG